MVTRFEWTSRPSRKEVPNHEITKDMLSDEENKNMILVKSTKKGSWILASTRYTLLNLFTYSYHTIHVAIESSIICGRTSGGL